MLHRYKHYFSVCTVQVIAFLVLIATCGLLTCLAFAATLAHLTIIFGHRLFGRKGW
jgi:hypothetical protein